MTGGMMFKGTPGPWSVLQSPSNTERYFVVDSGGSCISCDDEYSLEDASLSAAAPELLEALKNIVEDLEMRSKNGVVDCSHGIYCDARQAIAKALGEQK